MPALWLILFSSWLLVSNPKTTRVAANRIFNTPRRKPSLLSPVKRLVLTCYAIVITAPASATVVFIIQLMALHDWLCCLNTMINDIWIVLRPPFQSREWYASIIHDMIKNSACSYLTIWTRCMYSYSPGNVNEGCHILLYSIQQDETAGPGRATLLWRDHMSRYSQVARPESMRHLYSGHVSKLPDMWPVVKKRRMCPTNRNYFRVR